MDYKRGLSLLQKISMSIMAVLVLMTFIGANLHALLWQSSQWLVSTVLPAVVVDLTNEERTDLAQAPLVRNSTLDKAAQLKAEHMAKHGYFAHYSPEGVSPWYWFDEVGYVYAHAGENLAVHFTDSSQVVDGWMNSPTHRANIVSGLYTEIGVGTAKGRFQGYDTVFVVQLFGAPAVAPTSNAVAATTPGTDVTATLEDIRTRAEELAQVIVEDDFVASVDTPNEVVTETPDTQVEAESVSEPLEIETSVVAQQESPREAVVIETPIISTSSGLAIAQIEQPNNPTHAGFTASIATQPSTLLQMIYAVLSLVVVSLLGVSVVLESRRYHYQQVAYGILLLFGMSGLLFIHQLLTTGAVVV